MRRRLHPPVVRFNRERTWWWVCSVFTVAETPTLEVQPGCLCLYTHTDTQTMAGSQTSVVGHSVRFRHVITVQAFKSCAWMLVSASVLHVFLQKRKRKTKQNNKTVYGTVWLNFQRDTFKTSSCKINVKYCISLSAFKVFFFFLAWDNWFSHEQKYILILMSNWSSLFSLLFSL